MKWIFRIFISLIFTLLFLAAVFFLLVVDFTPPEFEKTTLTPEEEQEHYYTLRKLFQGRSGDELGVAFSPREVSFFCERYFIGKRVRGFKLSDLKIDTVGDRARVKAAFRSPVGLYTRLMLTGRLQFNGEDWKLQINKARLGMLPVGWLVPDEINPTWPSEVPGRELYLRSASLNGSGLRMKIYWGENSQFSLLELF